MCQILGGAASERLKQDSQDAQDEQDERQVRKDLHVYRILRKQEDKVREDLNVYSTFGLQRSLQGFFLFRSVRTCMSIESSGTKRTRSVRTLICPAAAAGTGARGLLRSAGACPPRPLSGCVFFFGACEGQALALRAPGRAFFSVHARDRPSRSLPHPGHPDNPGHPASDVRDIKVLTDLYSVLRRRAIDMKGLTDLCRILFILN